MLRVAAGLSLVLGVSLLYGFFYWIGESPIAGAAERHLREMKERTTAPDTIVPTTFADMVALPHGRPVAEYAAYEGRGVSLEGYTKYIQLSSDGDYHLSLSETPPPPLAVLSPTLTAELTPQWQRGSRWWQWEPLVTALRPNSWIYPAWPHGPRRVRVSGWLLYDFQYDEPFLKDKRPHLPAPAPHRLTGWEIHPVTRLELWDDSLGAYVEYSR
jgi:hypothetical protein